MLKSKEEVINMKTKKFTAPTLEAIRISKDELIATSGISSSDPVSSSSLEPEPEPEPQPL